MDKFWLHEPEKHDYPAAADYLELLFIKEEADKMVAALKSEKTIIKKAKDILRASALPLLADTNIHVRADMKKVKKGKKLSPVLLVRFNNKLIIADGYHRVCASYYLSEDEDIPCRLI